MVLERSQTEERGGYRQINKALNICAFDDYLKGQVASLPELPNVEQLSERVIRVLGQNPGKFTFQGTNTFLIGTGSERILVDTSGGEPEYAELLCAALREHDVVLKYVLITHWHGDHSGGAPDIARLYPDVRDHIHKNDPEPGQQDIADGQIFSVEGATVMALHAPGHSHDHMCFILEEESAMFTGDNILGHGTTSVEDLGEYTESLHKMKSMQCSTGHPAHGQTIHDFPAKMEREIALKLKREKQVMATLERLRAEGEKSVVVKELVTGMYGNSVDETTRTLALEPFIDEVLRKLAGDGKVGFEIRKGSKKWYPVMARTSRMAPLPRMHTVA